MKSVKKIPLRSAIVCCAVFLFTILCANNGYAQNYLVNSNTDANAVNLVTGDAGGGVITLRSAIQAATAQPGSHTITFSGAVVSPINLTLGQITVGNAANGNNITITGPGMNSLTVNQTTENRIFSTGTGAVTFLLQDITLNYTGPAVTPYSGGGGAIIAGGAGAATTLINCRISNFQRQIGNGGAISASSSLNNHSLTITNSIFTNNRAGGAGGAVSFNSQGGTATITGNIFDSNHTGVVGANTGGDGGAVSVTGGGSGGTYLIQRNTFLNNQVENTTGHAGAIMSTNGTSTIRYNRFIGNTCLNVANPPLANIIGQAGGATTHVTIANDNWWGVNTGPGANDATALAAGAVMTLTQWLQLRDVISGANVHNTNQIAPGTSANFTADILGLSSGGSTAAANLIGLATFPASTATIYTNLNPALATSFTPTSGQYVNGVANASPVFTSNGTKGTATINAVADNQTLGTPLVIGFTPVYVNPGGNDTVATAFTSNACGGAGFQPCFATIGAALANVAISGTINIQAGTYAENPNFNQNCTTNITGNVTLNGVTLTNGTLAGTNATTISVSGNWTNNGGTFTANGNTVNFNGSSPQTIGGTVTTNFNNLTINNTLGTNVTGVTLTRNATVNGTLTLTSSDLDTGAFTLTQPNTTASTGVSDVVGTVTRTGGPFPLGSLTFGNPNNIITFTGVGTRPTTITVVIAKAAPLNPNGYAAAVQRTYTVNQTGGSGFTATVRFHYLDTELNGNAEASLNLRRLRTTDNHWVAALPATRNGATNWVEASGVLAADLVTRWTMSSLIPTASDGTVTGRIVDGNGNPVEGAVIRLEGTQNRKFITDANGVYRFDQVETNGFYTVTPSRANYTFSPATRSFSLLGESTEATFGATLATSNLQNPLDTPEYFVRQHYIDFLGREPDEAGFNFWSDQILECGAEQSCVDRRRENVSAAYFLSIEFRETGGMVDGMYRASYGVAPEYSAFMPDTRTVGNGVIVGADNWRVKLEANKEAFVNSFVNRPTFVGVYGNMDNTLFVDTLIQHTGASFTAAERDALVTGLSTGAMTRGDALRSIAENQSFVNAKFNQSFVMMEYFGYLRRDPDSGGYEFWLNKLSEFGGNFERADMVKAFIVSGEYRDRFPR